MEVGYFTSTETDILDSKIAKIKKAIGLVKHNRTAVGKTRTGKDISYSFTDLPEMLRVLDGPMESNGVSFESYQVGDGYELNEFSCYNNNGKKQFKRAIHKIYEPTDYPHQKASAVTTSRRLFLYGILGIHPASDDDGNAVQGNDVKESNGEYLGGKVQERLEEMHEQVKPMKVTEPKQDGRSEEEVKDIMDRLAEEKAMDLVKFDRRSYKTLEEFVRKSRSVILITAINAAVRKSKMS